MQFTLTTLLAFASAAMAITITSPSKDQSVDLSKSTTVTWQSVNTDPTTVDIVLVNMAVNPPVNIPISQNVDVSKGSFTIPPVAGVSQGGTYQINFMGTTAQNQGIVAQSQQFDVPKSTPASSSGTSSGTSASTLSTGTSTATSGSSASASGSSSGSASASATGSKTTSGSKTTGESSTSLASGTGTVATASTSTGAAAVVNMNTFQGSGLSALIMGVLMMFA